MSDTGRNLVRRDQTPARDDSMSSGTGIPEGSPDPTDKAHRKRANCVRAACLPCQKRKAKCSGERPTCEACTARDLSCSWDSTDGLTRTADLKRRIQEAEERVATVNAFINILRHGTDRDATMLLARLRLGASVDDLVASLTPLEDLGESHRVPD